MSAIDRVKKLLAAAETECVGKPREYMHKAVCPRHRAIAEMRSLFRPIARALVESQEALREINPWVFSDAMGDVWVCISCEERVEILDVAKDQHNADCTYRAALRMDALEKAMER